MNEKDGEWHPWFAVIPVRVDAYDDEEMAAHGGKFSWLAVGRMQRRWHSWTDDETGETHQYWRYRSR